MSVRSVNVLAQEPIIVSQKPIQAWSISLHPYRATCSHCYYCHLGGLLLPALSGAKNQAQKTRCINNNKQLMLATIMYADDQEDVMPFPGWGNRSWAYLALPRKRTGMRTRRCYRGTITLFKTPDIYRCSMERSNQTYFQLRLSGGSRTSPAIS